MHSRGSDKSPRPMSEGWLMVESLILDPFSRVVRFLTFDSHASQGLRIVV
jgi:hypothetical protein